MDMVSKNHGFKWFAVIVFTLARSKMDGSGEARFAAVRFAFPDEVCGSVSIRFALNNIFLPELRHLPCLQL